MEPCKYENQINKLIDSVPRLEEKVNNILLAITNNNVSISSNTVVLTNLLLAQERMDGIKSGIEKQKETDKIAENLKIETQRLVDDRERITRELEATQRRDKIQRRFLYVMAGLVFLGLIINGYFGFKNSKVPGQVKQSIDNMEGISKVTRGGYIKYNDEGLSDSIKIK